MKFRCLTCQENVPAHLVLAHEESHKTTRVVELIAEMSRVTRQERLEIMDHFCELCGSQISNAEGICTNPHCDADAESERPQGGGGPDQSPLETAPTPVGVRPISAEKKS